MNPLRNHETDDLTPAFQILTAVGEVELAAFLLNEAVNVEILVEELDKERRRASDAESMRRDMTFPSERTPLEQITARGLDRMSMARELAQAAARFVAVYREITKLRPINSTASQLGKGILTRQAERQAPRPTDQQITANADDSNITHSTGKDPKHMSTAQEEINAAYQRGYNAGQRSRGSDATPSAATTDAVRAFGFVYLGPAQTTVNDWLAEVFGPGARSVGHFTSGPARTVYCFRARPSIVGALAAKLKASKFATYFEMNPVAIEAEHATAAEATIGGEGKQSLPIIEE